MDKKRGQEKILHLKQTADDKCSKNSNDVKMVICHVNDLTRSAVIN